jgi:hypothetical protein
VYTITATPYQNANATGAVGTPKTITITIIKPAAKMGGEESGSTTMGDLEEEKDAKLSAYPNPFSEKLNLEFTLPENSRVKVELFDVTGKRVAHLFEGDAKGSEVYKIEYLPETRSNAILIYRLQTDQKTYFGKVIMTP